MEPPRRSPVGRSLAGVVLAGAMLTTAACGGRSPTPSTPTATAQVTGTVSYRLRGMPEMPEDATIEIVVHDLTERDAESVLLGKQTITDPRQVPVGFAVDYDPARVVEANPYGVTATIVSGEDPWMTNAEVVPVITQGAPTTGVEVAVAPLGDTAP